MNNIINNKQLCTESKYEPDDRLKVTISVDKELDYADWSIRQTIDFEDEYMHNI